MSALAALTVLFAASETDHVSPPVGLPVQGCCPRPAAVAPRNVTVVAKPVAPVIPGPHPPAHSDGGGLADMPRLEVFRDVRPQDSPQDPPGALLRVADAAPALPGAPDAGPRVVPASGAAGRDAEAEAASAAIDPSQFRSGIAGTLVGVLAAHARPSRLLGDQAAGSLLARTADAYWGIGEQAAMRLIVEGKPPEIRQVVDSAVRITAAAANQNVAMLVDGATQFGKDNAIPFLRNLELSAAWYPGDRPQLEARTIDSLFQSAALDQTLFLQASVTTDFEDTTANLGLGYRYSLPDSRWMLGLNAFYDHAFPIGHQRMSIGLEASTDDFTLFGNRYIALSGWTEKNADYEERPLSGWDAGIAGKVPAIEDLSLSLAAFHWQREAHPDKTGLKLTADYDLGPALQLGATLSADDRGDVQAGFRFSYQFGADQFRGDIASGPAADRRLDFVNRENVIRTEKREIPRNYMVNFLDAAVTVANQSAIALTLVGAPRAARYAYRITSSNGGAPITGTGQLEGDSQVISGIDVSALPDGLLILTLRVTSEEGATGPPVTAQIVKSTAALGVTTAAGTGSPTNANPIPFTIRFSRAVTEFDLARLTITNGSAANLRSDDGLAWSVDVTPAVQGMVTLEVPAGIVASDGITSTASSQASVVFDSQPPSGYAVSFLSAPFTAAGFEITGGEAGSIYHFTIASSAGGSPVTGSGVMDAAQQQVTGLDLSGLPDGTLTLSVTLSDALNNGGAAASATLDKQSAGPLILAVVPPSAGDYDDL